MSKKYVILGANGQLGKALRVMFPNAKALSRQELDIANEAQVNMFDWSKYDVILNAAALVNADGSETLELRAKTWLANAYGPRNLAKVAIEQNKTLVHYSSDYVWDGREKNHQDDEVVAPLLVYGESKAAGDLAVSLVPKHYIMRVSWVVGDGHNMPKTMKNLADMRINPKVVNDQFGRLTFASEIARATKYFLDNKVAYGLYNVTNEGPVKSWYEIAADVFEYAGYDRSRVQPISTEEYAASKPGFAPRPLNSDMDLSKLRQTGFVPSDYTEMLKEYVKQLSTNK